MEGSFEELVSNVNAWFEDHQIVNLSGVGFAKDKKIERIITCLLPPRRDQQDYSKWIAPVGAERLSLWQSALRNRPISRICLAKVTAINTRFVVTNQLEEAERSDDKMYASFTISLLQTRMGLMKAFHVRKQGESRMSNLKSMLNDEHPAPAYHCGRLMAVLAALQRAALGDVGAGVVQRYYAAASTTPALVLGRLVRNGQFHLAKIKQESPGLAHWFEEKLSSISGRIGDAPPRALNLEEQSLFALGYYQQLANRRTEESDETTKEKGETP